MLERLPWLLALQAVILAILAFPLRPTPQLHAKLVGAWQRRADDSVLARFLLDQFEGFVSFFHDPLILKGTLAGMTALMFLAAIFARRLLAPIVAPDAQTPRPRVPRFAYATWLLFFAWASVSALRSPTRALSLEAVPFVLAIGGMGFVLLRYGISRDRMRQLAALLVLLGVVISGVSILQATELFDGLIFKILVRYDDPRNFYGSLLGHNTAVASFTLMTLMPAIALAVGARRWRTRLPTIGYIAMAAFAMLVTQSRAIWMLAPALTVVFIVVASRRAGTRWPARLTTALLALGALTVASQTVRSEWNPFYIDGNPIVRRLEHFKPDTIVRGTRFRIYVCSRSLIADRPLFGHGLYAFPYVYPKAQADYFARHPDTRIVPTLKRTRMAHNDYLQTLIEQGAAGLLLFVLALGEVFRRGFRQWRREGDVLHLAFGFSALAMALHAFVDFPFTIPQLAMPWILCASAFGGFRRENKEGASTIREPSAAPRGDPTRFSFMRTGRLTAAMLLLFFAPLAAYSMARMFQADVYYLRSAQMYELLTQRGSSIGLPLREREVRRIIDGFKTAVRTRPTHDLARQFMAEVYYYRAGVFRLMEQELPEAVKTANAPALHSLRTALEHLDASRDSLRYYHTFFLYAKIYEMLMELNAGPETARYEQAYRENLALTLYYAPSHSRSAWLLAEHLASRAGADQGRIIQLRRQIYRYDPKFFYDRYAARTAERLEQQDYGSAAYGGNILLQVDPNNPWFLRLAIGANMMLPGEQNRARVLEYVDRLDEVTQNNPRWPRGHFFSSYAGMYRAIVRGNWSEALEQLDFYGAELPRARAFLLAVERWLREKLDLQGLPTRFQKPEDMDAEAWEVMKLEEKAIALYHVLGEPERAREVFRRRLEIEEPEPSVRFWAAYGYFARDYLQDDDLLAICVEEMREKQPDHMMIERFEDDLARMRRIGD